MKHYLYVFALLLAVSGAYAAVVDSATLNVELLRYEPVPAGPGDTITVWLQVTNDGGAAAQNTVLEIAPSYPFTPVSVSESTIHIGTLASHSEYVTKVNVAIDRSAPQGEFELPVRIRSGGASIEYTPTIEVEVVATSIAVQSVRTSPDELIPGDRATISVTLVNVEESLVRDVTLSMNLADSVFAPVGSSTQQKIASLDGGEKHTFSFEVVTAPDAASSVYKIPLQLNFTTTSGVRLGQQETIGLIVHAEPELAVVVDEAELYDSSAEGTVLLRLVNKGLSEVKFVEITVLDGEGYEIGGNARTLYLGNIDSDDFETAEFAVEPTADEFSLNMNLNYRDSLNNRYNSTVQVPLRTTENPEGGSNTWLLAILAIAVIAGILWWRRSRKRR